MKEIVIEEYKAKWQYILHTESIQLRYIQWYFAIVGAILLFTADSEKLKAIPTFNISVNHSHLFFFLFVYSNFVLLRLLLQKKNYNGYTNRLMQIDGSYVKNKNRKQYGRRVFTVFKIQYYSVTFVGTLVSFLTSVQLSPV